MHTIEGMYRALLYQLLSQNRHMIQGAMLAYDWGHTEHSEGETFSWSEDDILELLHAVLGDENNSPARITIFIDALNECSGGHSITSIIQSFCQLIKRHVHRRLHICVSTRHVGASSHFQCLAIEAETENLSDIRIYLEEQFDQYSKNENEFDSIKRQIEKRSCGIFLWVELAVGVLKRELDRAARNTKYLASLLSTVPTGLQEVYQNILNKATDRQLTLRFFQWAILSPNLSLSDWRDLLPFLQQPTPISLKKSRESAFWAADSPSRGDAQDWMANLEKLICEVSLGLMKVTESTDVPLDDAVGETISITGTAGSLSNSGDSRILRPVHESVRRFFQNGAGFAMLDSELGHLRDGHRFINMMHTCLDFICLPEFDNLVTEKLANESEGSISNPQLSSDSERRSSRSSSVRSFISASSLVKNNLKAAKSTENNPQSDSDSQDGNGSEASARPNEQASGRTLRLAKHLLPEGEHTSEQMLKYRLGLLLDDSITTNFAQPVNQPSKSSLKSGWSTQKLHEYPEFLSFILTAFPRYALFAEDFGAEANTIIVRLREGRLWDRWICLSEDISRSTTLRQWAETEGLLTWVRYLNGTRRDPYQNSHFRNRVKNHSGNTLFSVTELNLSYCFDRGDGYIHKLEAFDAARAQSSGLRILPINSGLTLSQVKEQLWDEMVGCQTPMSLYSTRKTSILPYLRLRKILTISTISMALDALGLEKEYAILIYDSYQRVFALLLLWSSGLENTANLVVEFIKQQVNDRCLPLSRSRDSRYSGDIVLETNMSHPSIKVGFHVWTTALCFLKFQHRFLSPFFAVSSGRPQHYILDRDAIAPFCEVQSSLKDFLNVRIDKDSFEFGGFPVTTSPLLIYLVPKVF